MLKHSRLVLSVLAVGIVVASLAICGVNAQSGPAKPAGTGAGPQSGQTSGPASGPKMTEDVFKNIQVLKGVPADQLIPTMQFISASLGVECDFCHVQGAFDKDDKKPKQTARLMMQMMFAINKDNFAGHREVTCYSCHRGATEPLTIPVIAEAETKPMTPPSAEGEKKASLPTVDDVLNKYVKAIGGADALKKISTRVEKGTATIFGGRKIPVEVFAKAPDKRAAIMHVAGGDSTTAFDGKVGWMGMPRRPVREVSGGDLDALKLDADFLFPADAKEIFSDLKTEGPEPVGTHQAYVVVARREGQPPVKLYFDIESGLLLRQIRYVETPLGRLPTQIDYDDYRDSGGVKVPFQWTIARPENRFTMQMESAETNVPIDDTKFARPPEPPPPPAK
jgi:photosynthetic reaction center cytochrome c subunit